MQQNLNSNPRFMRLSADFGNGSMDLSGIIDANGPSLWSNTSSTALPTSSPYAAPTNDQFPTLARNSNEHPNRRDQRRFQQSQNVGQFPHHNPSLSNRHSSNVSLQPSPRGPPQQPQPEAQIRRATFRKPLSRSYRQASNNPKGIGVLPKYKTNIITLDHGIKQHLSQFSNLPIDFQHKTISKYEENHQTCKIMNKPFHFSDNDRAYRASMYSQADMEYEHTKLVLATGKEWFELSPDQQKGIYDQVNNMAQQTRNVLIRCLTIESYYRNKLQSDIYGVLDKHLRQVKDYRVLGEPKDNGGTIKLKDEILLEIRDLLRDFQQKYMQYTFKYIIKIEFMERKDRRSGIKDNKIDKKKMRKHKNMGKFYTTSQCVWDKKNDDFIAIQWPQSAYYKPIRPIPKLPTESQLEAKLKEVAKEAKEKQASMNNNNNNNDNDPSVTTNNENGNVSNNEDSNEENIENKENGDGDGNSSGSDDNNNNDNEETSDEQKEINMRLALREKMRRQVGEEEAKWEDSFLKPVYCLLSIWALKTYDYFYQNLPNYAKDLPKAKKSKSIDMKKLNVDNKDFKTAKHKEHHSRTVSFATANKIVEGSDDEESESPVVDDRMRSKTVDIRTDDEYDDEN